MAPKPSQPRGPHAPKGPRVKLSQVVALDPKLADILEKHKVRKPRTVDKVENLEKWIASRGWRLAIAQGSGDGTHAQIELPGPDGMLSFEATDTTMALAITVALCRALEEGPRQANFMETEYEPDASGRDLPLFRDHGAADDVEERSDGEPETFHADEADFRGKADDVEERPDDEPETFHSPPADADHDPGFENHSYDGDRILYTVAPADDRLWREHPVDILRYADGEEEIQVGDSDFRREPEGWYLAYGFAYDPARGLLTDPQSGKTYWSRVMPKQHGFAAPAAAAAERRAIERPTLVDENAWLQDLPTALEIEYDQAGAWTFYLKPGFVYVINDGAIYDAAATLVWTRRFPMLGTADHPAVPAVPDLEAELQRRQTVAWHLQESGEIGGIFVDGDTLEYCVDRPNIESGENEELALDQSEVEAAYQRVRAAGAIPAPLSDDEDEPDVLTGDESDGFSAEEAQAVESEPRPDMGDFTGERLDALARSYAAEMTDWNAVDEPAPIDSAGDSAPPVDEDAAPDVEIPDDEIEWQAPRPESDDEADIFLEENLLQVAAYVRDVYPALSPRDTMLKVGELQKQHRTIAAFTAAVLDTARTALGTFEAQMAAVDAVRDAPAEEVAEPAAAAGAIGQAPESESERVARFAIAEQFNALSAVFQGKGAGDVEAVEPGGGERWGEADQDFSVAAQEAAEGPQPDDPAADAPASCQAISSGSGAVCGNAAEPVPGMKCALCPSHLGYARKNGAVRLVDGRILWHDGAHWTMRFADKPDETIESAPDLGKSRAARVIADAPESAETIRAALNELNVTWSGNVPELPPAGRGRPSKMRAAIEETFADLARRYLEASGQPSGRIVNGGILPNIGPGTPDIVLEEILS